MRQLPRRVIDAIAWCAEVSAALALVIDLAITFSNTIARYVFNSGIEWSDDASTICVAIMTFLGGATFLRRSSGLAYTAAVDQISGLAGAAMRAVGHWGVLTVCAISLYVFPVFFAVQQMQTLPVLQCSEGIVGVWMGIGLSLMALFTLEKLVALGPLAILASLGPVVALGGILLAVEAGALGSLDPLIPVAIVMAVGFLTAMPVPFILALGGICFLLLTGEPDLVAAPAAYQAGISSFILLAAPFFLVAGLLMEVTGMAARLVEAVREWIGHVRGGLLLAQVVAMYIFSGMSGSKAADIATIGSVMKQPLRMHGYPSTESVAVLAASAAMGEVIPPSLALLVLGSISSLSVGSLFLAGLLPAALLAVTLMAGILFRAKRGGLPKGSPFDLRRALRSLPGTIPALVVPVIVIGGIVGGVASPTEASSFAVVYALLAALVFYRSVRFATLWPAVRSATMTAGMLLFMVGTANLLSQVVVIDGLARTLSGLAASMGSATAFLFASIAALIVLGFVLEGFPAILISAPILLPIATQFGIDPLQYGILLVMAVGIGVFMPPIGIGFYVACTIGESSAHETMRASAIYNVFLLAGLVIAMLVPAITLALPAYFGMH